MVLLNEKDRLNAEQESRNKAKSTRKRISGGRR